MSLFGDNSVVGRTMVLHAGVDDLGKGKLFQCPGVIYIYIYYYIGGGWGRDYAT